MIIPDVNVLVSAFHAGAPDHPAMKSYLESLVNGAELVGVSDAILVGTVRVLTHPKVFTPPATVDQALAAVNGLVAHPRVRVVRTAPDQWRITADLIDSVQARGNLASDAGHAAHAIGNGATFMTKDRDFTRFPGLRTAAPDVG